MGAIDLLFAVRPLVLIPAWSFFLLGAGRSAGTADFPWLRLGLFTAVMIGVHLINQVADRDSDRLNAKGFFLQQGIFTPGAYVAASSVCIGVGLGVAWITGATAALLTASALLGLAYSLPPLRLTARPGLDLAANAIGYGALAPVLGAGGVEVRGAAFVGGTMLAVAAVFVHTTLLDLEGDRRTGKRSIGVVLGARAGRALAVPLAGAAVVAALVAPDRVLAVAAGVLTLLCLAAWARPERVTSRALCVGGTAIYVLAASVRWPPFLLAIAALAGLTRLYYARRFRIRYPAL